MHDSIRKVEGIGEEYQSKLEYIGIRTIPELLAKTQTQEQRTSIANQCAIPVGHINNWSTMLDLTRIDGVGYQFAELFTYSGIKSVDDFRKRSPVNLFETIKEANDDKGFTGTVPSVELLEQFISNSKKITNIVERY